MELTQIISWTWRRSMAGGKKAQKNQKDDLNLKNQKDNLSQNNPDNLRLKNQENLFQKQLQDHLQRILKYPQNIKDGADQRRMLHTKILAPSMRRMGSTQKTWPLTVRWVWKGTVIVLHSMAYPMAEEGGYVGPR